MNYSQRSKRLHRPRKIRQEETEGGRSRSDLRKSNSSTQCQPARIRGIGKRLHSTLLRIAGWSSVSQGTVTITKVEATRFGFAMLKLRVDISGLSWLS